LLFLFNISSIASCDRQDEIICLKLDFGGTGMENSKKNGDIYTVVIEHIIDYEL